jgi:hypothetical protein
MESQTSTYLNRKYSYQILESLSIELEIAENPYRLPLEELFVMAARRNKKRSFLFVSKILGKHLPINPSKGLLTGLLLADRYTIETVGNSYTAGLKLEEEFLKEKPNLPEAFIPAAISPVIIGFAETATALGQAFFAAFKKAEYFHTTRELIAGETPIITFEEEHSHATSHRCYIPRELLDNRREIVLVDDEMSTGKTAINIIRSIHAEFPRDSYTVVSILDWRSDKDVHEFASLEAELNISINCVSLLRGNFNVTGHSPEKELQAEQPTDTTPFPRVEKIYFDRFFAGSNSSYQGGKLEGIPYYSNSGRFGVNELDRDSLELILSETAAELSRKIEGKFRTLCIGTGEFMYIPMAIASKLEGNVMYQSTTRSPIHIVNKEAYGARYGMAFPNPEDPEIQHYLYNIAPYQYDHAMIIFEREVPDEWLEPMLREFQNAGIDSISLVFLRGKGVGTP